MSVDHKSELIFTFKSAHHAIAAEQALIDVSIQVRVMPLPANIGAGCGICLRIWPEERSNAIQALAHAGICPQGIWQRLSDENGTRYIATDC